MWFDVVCWMYVRASDKALNEALAQQQVRAVAYARLVPADSVDGNAADWYRAAFAKIPEPSPQAIQQLQVAVRRDGRATVSDRALCSDASGEELLTGMRAASSLG